VFCDSRIILQASENVQLHFIPTYWPDIGFWDLFPVILDYQAKVWSQQGKTGAGAAVELRS
jgi:hypothetical protein